jgi:probable phosphoglycerate mutase
MARHGQTHSNILGRYAGRSSESLTELGRAQVMELAARLALIGLGEVWSSEIARARESAEIVASVLGVPLSLDPRLNELVMGPWEGLTEGQVEDRYPDAYVLWSTMPDRLTLDGRETLGALAVRVGAVVRRAADRPRPVLLMTHVAPIRVAILTALGLPLYLYKRISVGNGDCACIGANGDGTDARRLGEQRSIGDDVRLGDGKSSAG